MARFARSILAALVLLTAYFCLAAAAEARNKGTCFHELRKSLVEGGYTGGLECNLIAVRIRHVGRISFPRARYEIYDLHYRTRTFGWGVSHYGRRLLIFDHREQYLGQYSGDAVNGDRIWLSRDSIRIDSKGFDEVVIHFTEGGPPKTVRLTGWTSELGGTIELYR
jgi:hypothetical protein